MDEISRFGAPKALAAGKTAGAAGAPPGPGSTDYPLPAAPIEGFAPGTDQADARFVLAERYHRLGMHDAAEASYRAALEARPGFVPALQNLALLAYARESYDEAVQLCLSVLDQDPLNFTAYVHIAQSFLQQGKLEGAELAAQQALLIHPGHPRALNTLGLALKAMGRIAEAEDLFRQALHRDPTFVEAKINLGNLLQRQGCVKEALACYLEVAKEEPDNAALLSNLGNACQSLGLIDAALAFHERAVRLTPKRPIFHWNYAIALLLAGDYARGWREYEWGFAAGTRPKRHFPQPRWQGESLQGKTLLVWAEQGLGDTIQFVRFLPQAQARGARVILACQEELVTLLQNCPGADAVISLERLSRDPPAFELQAPLMSLPAALETTLERVPAEIPYLRVENPASSRWQRRIIQDGRLKIGIAWAGRSTHQADQQRSLPLACFAPLGRVPGVRLYSLQKGEAARQTGACTFPLVDLGPELGDFADTACAVLHLDLIIVVDTAAAHLAGALGKPVWTLLPYACDWRWLTGRRDSPWYPTMALYRQQAPGDWETVIRQVAADLGSQFGLKDHSFRP